MQGHELKAWRESHGWNQTQAARYLGTSQVNISRWEHETHDIPRTVDLLIHLLRQKKNLRSIENYLFKYLDT